MQLLRGLIWTFRMLGAAAAGFVPRKIRRCLRRPPRIWQGFAPLHSLAASVEADQLAGFPSQSIVMDRNHEGRWVHCGFPSPGLRCLPPGLRCLQKIPKWLGAGTQSVNDITYVRTDQTSGPVGSINTSAAAWHRETGRAVPTQSSAPPPPSVCVAVDGPTASARRSLSG